jgi:hypothetical protein
VASSWGLSTPFPWSVHDLNYWSIAIIRYQISLGPPTPFTQYKLFSEPSFGTSEDPPMCHNVPQDNHQIAGGISHKYIHKSHSHKYLQNDHPERVGHGVPFASPFVRNETFLTENCASAVLNCWNQTTNNVVTCCAALSFSQVVTAWLGPPIEVI